MKKWKILRLITIILLIILILFLICDAIKCMKMSYPTISLGCIINNWVEQFIFDAVFILLYFLVPLIIDITLLIISIIKIHNHKLKRN